MHQYDAQQDLHDTRTPRFSSIVVFIVKIIRVRTHSTNALLMQYGWYDATMNFMAN